MYRVRFQPKKSSHSVPANIGQTISQLLQALGSIDTEDKSKKGSPSKKGVMNDAAWQITHYGKEIVAGSNLRTIVAPDEDTKTKQRRLLHELERLPMHRAAHGFVRGRDAYSCAQAHVTYWGKTGRGLVVLNMDAKNFFHSISSVHLRRALEGHGISPKNTQGIIETCTLKPDKHMASAILDGLVVLLKRSGYSVSESLELQIARCRKIFCSDAPAGRKLAFLMCQVFLSLGSAITMSMRFLPQGAPTSPFLSNLTMKLADIRINALAKKMNGHYTRYADDLTVSWLVPTKGKVIDGMYRCVQQILGDYGIELNKDKKRVMGTSKPQDVVGYIINSGRPTISRRTRRRLRAALHNEMVRGSLSFRTGTRQPNSDENYDRSVPTAHRLEHLQGMVSWIGTAHRVEAAKQRRIIQHIRHGPIRDFGPNDQTHDNNPIVELPASSGLGRDLDAE